MKTLKTLIFSGILILGSSFCFSQNDDDIYYSPKDQPAVKTEKQQAAPSRQDNTSEQDRNSESVKSKSSSRYSSSFDRDDYYDYAYAARIRRFHRPCGLSYYDPFYTNLYYYDYNPYNWGVSIYYGYSWWRPHFYPHYGIAVSYGYGFYDPWYSPYHGYGHYSSGYYHGFHDGYYSSKYDGKPGRSVHYGPRGSVSSNVSGYNRSSSGGGSARLENRASMPIVVPNRVERSRSESPVYRSNRSNVNSQPVRTSPNSNTPNSSAPSSNPVRNSGNRPDYGNRSNDIPNYERPRNTERPSYENRSQERPVYSAPQQSSPAPAQSPSSGNSNSNSGSNRSNNSGGPVYRPR